MAWFVYHGPWLLWESGRWEDRDLAVEQSVDANWARYETVAEARLRAEEVWWHFALWVEVVESSLEVLILSREWILLCFVRAPARYMRHIGE